MKHKCEVCNTPFVGRRDAKFCSGVCRQKAVRQIQSRDGKSGGGIDGHPLWDSYLKGVTVPDTKSQRVSLAKCAVCGAPTKQLYIDRFTLVFHADCVGKTVKEVIDLSDRTALWPDVYGPNATSTIFHKSLGGNFVCA